MRVCLGCGQYTVKGYYCHACEEEERPTVDIKAQNEEWKGLPGFPYTKKTLKKEKK